MCNFFYFFTLIAVMTQENNFCLENSLLGYFENLTFSYSLNGRESIVFGQIFETEIYMNLHVMRFPESENCIFSIWSVCICV